jgi:hypothetical protein
MYVCVLRQVFIKLCVGLRNFFYTSITNPKFNENFHIRHSLDQQCDLQNVKFF